MCWAFPLYASFPLRYASWEYAWKTRDGVKFQLGGSEVTVTQRRRAAPETPVRTSQDTSEAATKSEGAKWSVNGELKAVSRVGFPSYQSSYIPGKLVRGFRDAERSNRETQRSKQVSTEKQEKQEKRSQRWKADAGLGRLQQRLKKSGQHRASGAEGQEGKRE